MIERWAPRATWTGFLFVVLVIAGGPVLSGSAPEASAHGRAVVAFYVAHRDRERAAAIVLGLAFLAFLCFASALRARWKDAEGADGPATLMLAAAAVLTVGQSTAAGVTYALAEHPDRLPAASAETLNLLANDLVIASAVGFIGFAIGAGLSIVRGGLLPAWAGRSALALAVLFVIPPIEFAGFLLLLVWVLAVTVMSSRRASGPTVPVAQPG